MKALIAIAVAIAAALGFLAMAQDKRDSKLPTAEERAKNREAVQESFPTAEQRAQNRQGVNNAALTTKVKTALVSNAGMKTTTRINVDSDNGVVTLKGKVDSAEAKNNAEQIAKKVEGVRSVKNQLMVEAPKKG